MRLITNEELLCIAAGIGEKPAAPEGQSGHWEDQDGAWIWVQEVEVSGGSREDARQMKDMDDGIAGAAGAASGAATVAFTSGFLAAAFEGAAIGSAAGPIGALVGVAVGVAVTVALRSTFRNAGTVGNLP